MRAARLRLRPSRLNADCLSLPERKLLHDMFWGELTMETAESYNSYKYVLRGTGQVRA